jgi:hypothetical protein
MAEDGKFGAGYEAIFGRGKPQKGKKPAARKSAAKKAPAGKASGKKK